MKKLFTILSLSLGALTFAQENDIHVSYSENNFQDVTMEITIDSAEELESTFQVEDVKELLELTGGKSATFKLTCRGELMSNGKPSTMSYEIEKGDMSEKEFIKMVKKIRKAAIKYYDNKQ